MKALKILTTAAVAGALVAGGVAGPAMAANPPVTAQPVINVSTASVVVPALTTTAPVSVNTTAGGNGSLELWLVKDGAVFDAGGVYQDDAGNATVDLVYELRTTVFNYEQPAAGTYTAYFTSEQASDYGYPTETIFLPAQSANITIAISKLTTKITGWKTKAKSAKYGKSVKISSPTITNGGTGKWVFQYKKKGAKKWKTSETGSVGAPLKWKFKTHAFNTIKYKRAKRGTYYFRVTIPGTQYVTGASTKKIKITWR